MSIFSFAKLNDEKFSVVISASPICRIFFRRIRSDAPYFESSESFPRRAASLEILLLFRRDLIQKIFSIRA